MLNKPKSKEHKLEIIRQHADAMKERQQLIEQLQNGMSFHDLVYIICVYVLGVVIIIYLLYFSIVAQKHFWRISIG